MTVKDIPTEVFNRIIKKLRSDQWQRVEEYDKVDAWIDYGMIKLEKNGVRLTFEWTNWDEGSIEGPDDTVQAIAQRYGLPVT